MLNLEIKCRNCNWSSRSEDTKQMIINQYGFLDYELLKKIDTDKSENHKHETGHDLDIVIKQDLRISS